MSEQDIITRFFNRRRNNVSTVTLGIGDDAALLSLPHEHKWVCSIDTLVEGVSFPKKTKPEDIGYKAMAVSLSDMAAMGAQPVTSLLSLTMPKANETWLDAFSNGLFELIDQYDMQLVGGDITRGPLTITTVVNGIVPEGKALRRNGAHVGDLIYVTNTLGDAGMGLTNKKETSCLQKLNRPTPRIKAGIALRNIATAAIDISDGLLIDLERLCNASSVGATIQVDSVPINKATIEMALTAGDDFELCFTAPPSKTKLLEGTDLGVSIQQIGSITESNTIKLMHHDGREMKIKKKGYDHF